MKEIFERTAMIIGEDGIDCLQDANVIIFGLGGVGGHVAEALARAGIGKMTLVDGDTVDPTNINRQIIATQNTVGKLKTSAMNERIKSINSDIQVNEIPQIYSSEDRLSIKFDIYDYVIDAIDDVSAKTDIIIQAKKAGIPVISAMGTGNKLRPELLEIADIYKTEVCPLAKAMRKRLRQEGITDVKVVYSREEPVVKSTPPGSISFVPGAAGLLMAGEVTRSILIAKGKKNE